MKKISEKIFATIFFKVLLKTTLSSVFVVGVFYTIVLFRNLKTDTTVITNSAFAIAATLASLSFSYARAVGNSDEDRETIVYAAERFFNAAIFLLTASLLKYFLIHFASHIETKWALTLAKFFTSLLAVIVPPLFTYALFDSLVGLKRVFYVLWNRTHRLPGWGKLF